MSAGAITNANRIGVMSGTNNSRGVRTVSWNRRHESVAIGPRRGRAARLGRATSRVMVVMALLPPSGGFGRLIAGEPQVDVIQGRWTTDDRDGGHAGVLDVGDHLLRSATAHRNDQRRTDRERVGAC